jgi:folate-binding protein YgfZ
MDMDAAIKHAPWQTPLAGAHRAAGANVGEWFGCTLPSDYGDWQAEYRFARESVALLDKNYRAYLGFTGPDRVRYLNAILTNDIKDLKTGEGIVSLFLNPQGRIQAEIEAYAEPEKLFCVSFAMIREKLIPALDHFIIMDDVTLTEESERFATLALEGPLAAAIVKQLCKVDLAGLPELSWKEAKLGAIPCRIVRRSFRGVPNAEFLCEQSQLSALWGALNEGAKSHGGGPAGYTALSALRLEAGIPWFGYDFGEKQIPHEAGLESSHISYTKGCYTGQEIVERVRSRGRVNRVLALFQLSAAELPAAETPIVFAGKEIGYVTRAAYSPGFESNIAMGYIRREQSASGSEVQISGASATAVSPR